MKKIIIIFGIFLGLFSLYNLKVNAEEKGPVVVQAILQDGYDHEINVELYNAETKETVGKYKLNDKNNWLQKDTVPVGKYKILAYVEGLSETRGSYQVKETLVEREVVANPVVKGNIDKTPRFVVMEADKEYMSRFYGMVDFQRLDGSMLKGHIKTDEMKKYVEEAINMQGEDNSLGTSDGTIVGEASIPSSDVKSEYTPLPTKDVAKGEKIIAEKTHKKYPVALITIVAVILGSVSGYFGYYFFAKRRK